MKTKITKSVSVETLVEEYNLPFDGTDEIIIVSNELIDSSRWANLFKLIIHDLRDDTYWSMRYRLGTGDEGERPWEHEDVVQLTRVYPKLITITTYVDTPTEDMPEWEQGVYSE